MPAVAPKIRAVWFFMLVLAYALRAEATAWRFTNPILPGFHPDLSIYRVGDDYCMVHITFEYFPAVPIFESKDLVNWKQIGHVLTRKSQLHLDQMRSAGGISLSYDFFHQAAAGVEVSLGTTTTRDLSTETLTAQQNASFNFTGVFIGLYATGNGTRSTATADFDWFEYQSVKQ